MAGSTDFISGRHVRARVYFNNSPWELKAKSVRVEELATEVEDEVNGEARARFQKITKGFRVTLDCYDDGASSQILQNWILNQQNEDNFQPQLPLAGGLKFSYLDGTAGGFVLNGGANLGPLNTNIGGRSDRVMHTVVFRVQYFSTVPTS